jgi:hypothetical protein
MRPTLFGHIIRAQYFFVHHLQIIREYGLGKINFDRCINKSRNLPGALFMRFIWANHFGALFFCASFPNYLRILIFIYQMNKSRNMRGTCNVPLHHSGVLVTKLFGCIIRAQYFLVHHCQITKYAGRIAMRPYIFRAIFFAKLFGCII